jgi:opacity protein-like surface antigen
MRKSPLLFFAAFFIITNANAQIEKWNLSASVGASLPVGKFGSKNIYDSTASFAELGPAINISLDYNLTKHFGLALLLTGQQNNVDTKSIDKKWEEASPGTRVTATSNNWQIGKIMAGGFISLSLDKHKKFYFTARVMAGALKTNALKFSLFQTNNLTDSFSLNNPPTTSNVSEMKTLNWAFAYLAGVGVKYNVNKKVYLLSNFDYSGTSLRFQDVYYSTTNSIGGGVLHVVGTGTPPATPSGITVPYPKQSFTTINICVGAGICF